MRKFINKQSDGTFVAMQYDGINFDIYKTYNVGDTTKSIKVTLNNNDVLNLLLWIDNHLNGLNYSALKFSNGCSSIGYTEFTNLPRLELKYKNGGIDGCVGILLCNRDLQDISQLIKTGMT